MIDPIRKGMCPGCPYDYGKSDTESAYNLGCLPGVSKIREICEENDTAWACHGEPGKVCCGYAAMHKGRIGKPLEVIEGVHAHAD